MILNNQKNLKKTIYKLVKRVIIVNVRYEENKTNLQIFRKEDTEYENNYLQRIHENYQRLNTYANEVLAKYGLDERTIEIFDNNFGMETKVNLGVNWASIGQVEPSKAMDFAKHYRKSVL